MRDRGDELPAGAEQPGHAVPLGLQGAQRHFLIARPGARLNDIERVVLQFQGSGLLALDDIQFTK